MNADTEKIRALVEHHTAKGLSRREFVGRAVGLGLSMSAAASLFAACGSSSHSSSTGSSASSGGSPKPPTTTLTYRPQNDIANLDPAFYASQDDNILSGCIYEGLVTFKPGTWDVVNCLADTFEPSKDGLRYHFRLKKGIPWQKGYGEVRASDVKFSFERIAGLTKPNLKSPYVGDWSALETVQVTGPYDGTIILKKPFAPIMRSTLPVGSGQVLPEKAVTALGKKWATNPVGSGPYEFVSWTPGQSAKLKKFSEYGGANKSYTKPAPWTEIHTQVINSGNTAIEALQTGSVALAWLEPSLIDQARHASALRVTSRPSLNYYFLSISQKNVPNLNVRRAVRSAIDVPAVIQAAYSGEYQQAYGIIPASMGVGYWADAPHYKQDIGLAKQYLAKSGMSNVDLTLTTTNDQPSESASQVIAANLGQIGVKVKIIPEDTATMDAIPGNGGGGAHRQLVYSEFVTEPDPYWSFIWFTCSQMNLWNWCDWCNPSFNNLLDKAIRTYDVAERNKLYTEAAKLWDAQANIVWLAYPTLYFAGQKWVQPNLRPDGQPNLWVTT